MVTRGSVPVEEMLSAGQTARRATLAGGEYVELSAELRESVRGEVRFDRGTRAMYANDASIYRQPPIGVVIPEDAGDVARALACCRRHGAPVLARGCGTGLAGQSVNAAVMFDFSKYMNEILELDAERRTARVQPGVICDQLRAAAGKHGLTFAPDPATHDHCTLGGMIGNNSCGTHSVMGGKTVDNVIALDVITYDGTRMTVGQTSEEEYAAIQREGGRRADIYRQLARLRERYATLVAQRYPDIPRRVSGYNLDELGQSFDVARALVGSESTCVLVLEATVRLLPDPPFHSLLVAGFPNAAAAAEAVPAGRETDVIGLEFFDIGVVRNLQQKGTHMPGMEELPPGRAWLLAEYGGQSKAEADAGAAAFERRLRATGSTAVKLFDDPAHESDIWEVRRSAIGSTRIPGQHPGLAGWEDAAVHPDRLAAYLREFQELVEHFGYHTVLFGHFGQGCVHCRLDLDLASAEGLANFRAFIDAAADLVVRYEGSLSGEHGDGQLRAALLPKMYGPELIEAFREFKAIFDPDGRMNPGKVVNPYRPDQNVRLGTDYRPRHVRTHFSFVEDGGSFADAANRCFGVGKCRHLEGGTMCPSFMVTREEEHSTRGRARLLFEMLSDTSSADGWRDASVKEALDLCLSCKGCKGDCPVSVDMATYKAEFLSHYYAGRLRPRAAYALGFIPLWARLASHAPVLANAATAAPGLSRLMKAAGGVAPHRKAPTFAHRSFTHWFTARQAPARPGAPPVLLWPDTFNNFFTPGVAKAATEVLEGAGFDVRLPRRWLCCGRPLYDYGMLRTAKRWLRRVLDELRDDLSAGTPVVGLEPSCVAVFRDELINLFPHDADARRLSQQVYTFSEFLTRKAPDYEPPKLRRRALVQAHCHHQAVMGMDDEERLMAVLGLDVERPDSGCCGMAGSFGYEAGERYRVSLAVGERVILPKVRETAPDTLVIADGFSCREQIAQATGRQPLHIAEVVALATTNRDGGR
ncbi:MAG: FAD-binding protein [Acidimicrobiaceae bacterium]|nr:FAD-binding protein [Acidimicrobiaceae bacterium]